MIRKFIHTVLAFVILVSTTGFTISLHYCHDHIYDLAVFSEAHSCCEPDSKAHCHAPGDMDPVKHCEDESISVEPTDDYIGSSFQIEPVNTHILDLFLTAHVLLQAQGVDHQVLMEPPWHKEPPPCREVVLSQIQTYLI